MVKEAKHYQGPFRKKVESHYAKLLESVDKALAEAAEAGSPVAVMTSKQPFPDPVIAYLSLKKIGVKMAESKNKIDDKVTDHTTYFFFV